jgi:NAD(P)-dependent dehydrogenase (short-subunit alcohol dehydrogenase family)
MGLDPAVAIVTGAAQGIGLAAAERLAQRGARVVLADLRGAEAAAAGLREQGLQATGIEVDVSQPAQVSAMVAHAEATFGRLDVLVNNAGVFATLKPKPFEQLTVDEWRQVLDVNVIGVFLCCQAALPAFRRMGGGRIVNISSGVAFKGNPGMAHYVASKGAVVSLTRALATELGRHQVLVNSVAPGFTLSAGVTDNPALIEGAQGPSLRGRVLGRDMLPADVIGAIEFFSGPLAAFVTGQTLVVDGGAYFH